MNVFHKYTLRALLKNKTRTVVTLIGIVLSMALVTAVIEGAYSGQQFLIRNETNGAGAYHGLYYGLTAEQKAQVEASTQVAKTAALQEVGWAEIGSENESKPYLLIQSVSGSLEELLAVHLLSGRMPENDGEILLPEHLTSNGNVSVAVGDVLTLDVGRRESEGSALSARTPYQTDAEVLTGTAERQYTVVGICSRFSVDVEPYSCPGYFALTKGGDGSATGSYTVLFTVQHPTRFYQSVEEIGFARNCKSHSSLLGYYGSLSDSKLSAVLYGFAGILLFLIAFGSISLIYNSFSISVSERTRQFGILKSVGATRRQIRGSVLFEAMVLCVIAVPVGLAVGLIGIGITLSELSPSFSSLFNNVSQTEMYLAVHPAALVISSVVCFLITLISAWIPARRALSLSPVDAIRQAADVRIRPGKIRRFRITQKLFGFEGMMAAKNFSRSKKQYRATVLSLFLSVTLFISSSSFSSYLTDAARGVLTGGTLEYDISCYGTPAPGTEGDVLQTILNVHGVEKSVYFQSYQLFLTFDKSVLSDRYLKSPVRSLDDAVSPASEVFFVEDETFRNLCRENGIRAEDYFQSDAPLALMRNQQTDLYRQGRGVQRYVCEVIRLSALPATGKFSAWADRDGYVFVGSIYENGTEYASYCPQEEYNRALEAEESIDESKLITVSVGEGKTDFPVTIGAILEHTPWFAGIQNNCSLYYPFSMRDHVLPLSERANRNAFEFPIVAAQHAEVKKSITDALRERGDLGFHIHDEANNVEAQRMFLQIIKVFSYGFIILISLIAAANVFNTVSTGIALRRREIAMLRSVGLSQKSFRKMMNYECLIYGLKSLAWGLPASVLITYALYRVVRNALDITFYLPWHSVLIAVCSVFAVVFASMFYAAGKLRKDNTIEALRTEIQ